MVASIPGIARVIKRSLQGDLYLIIIIVLVGAASFGLGRLSVIDEEREPVTIESSRETTAVEQGAAVLPAIQSRDSSASTEVAAGQYVASKNSDKYHFPWCSGAQRIKEENKVWFQSREEALAAGYTPASNCKGLQ